MRKEHRNDKTPIQEYVLTEHSTEKSKIALFMQVYPEQAWKKIAESS
jgi:hypothetical protein